MIIVTEQLVCSHQVDVFLSPLDIFFNALNLFVDEYLIEFIVIISDRRTRSSSEPCSFGPDSILLFRSQTQVKKSYPNLIIWFHKILTARSLSKSYKILDLIIWRDHTLGIVSVLERSNRISFMNFEWSRFNPPLTKCVIFCRCSQVDSTLLFIRTDRLILIQSTHLYILS